MGRKILAFYLLPLTAFVKDGLRRGVTKRSLRHGAYENLERLCLTGESSEYGKIFYGDYIGILDPKPFSLLTTSEVGSGGTPKKETRGNTKS